MTIDFITGKAGTDHIDGDDWRGMNASMVGLDDYVMKLRNQLAITVQDSNHVVIDTGMAMMNGGAANVTAAETVTVQSGTQGQKRNDLIVLRYTRTNSIEKAQLVCLRGTPTTGTPADPSYNRQSILLGSTTVHDMPLYRLPLNGITLGTPVKLFRTLGSLSEVWDSLNHIEHLFSDGQWSGTFPRRKFSATVTGRHVNMSLQVEMVDNWEVTAWEAWDILLIPDGYHSVLSDLNIPAACNGTNGAVGFQLNERRIAVRAFASQTLWKGMWISSAFGWDIAS